VITLADKCIALEPNNGNCWQWKGIGIGRRGTTKGILNSLSEIDDLETVFLKAESLKPEYRSENGSANAMGDIYNALGQFYRTVPDWFILKTLFGARGDIDRSVEYQRKAVAREPNRIEYNKELGVSLLCYGQKKNDDKAIAEGRKYLEKVSSLPVLKNSDIVDKDHARILLKNPDLACGYSRDAQQVISKEEFEKTREK
jgi:tetratricopeptide (TPR) repeat protein